MKLIFKLIISVLFLIKRREARAYSRRGKFELWLFCEKYPSCSRLPNESKCGNNGFNRIRCSINERPTFSSDHPSKSKFEEITSTKMHSNNSLSKIVKRKRAIIFYAFVANNNRNKIFENIDFDYNGNGMTNNN